LLDGQDVAPGAMPLLATGWRAEVVGHLLEDLLFGKASIRIQNPKSEQRWCLSRSTKGSEVKLLCR